VSTDFEGRTDVLLKALVALLAADRDERAVTNGVRRSEFVLADAGLNVQDIAALTGRNAEAVRSSLRRKVDKRNGSPGHE
jgi:hypothetical protein